MAIESLQEELIHTKHENEKLKKSSAAKAQQLHELQQQMETQSTRLAALDGRLAQGQGALTAACVSAQSKDSEMIALREAISSRDKVIREQAATVSRLDAMVRDAESTAAAGREREAALERERSTLLNTVQELKQHVFNRDAASASATATGEALQAQLIQVKAALAQEQSLRSATDNKTIVELKEALLRKEIELEAAEKKEALAQTDDASLRNLAEQLATERRKWSTERARLLQECHSRLEEAERWINRAAYDAEDLKREAAAAAERAARQISTLEKDLERCVDEARMDERHKVQMEQEAQARMQERAQEQASVADQMLEVRLREISARQHEAMSAEYDRFQCQVQQCLEALAENVTKHQTKTEKRQGKLSCFGCLAGEVLFTSIYTTRFLLFLSCRVVIEASSVVGCYSRWRWWSWAWTWAVEGEGKSSRRVQRRGF